jgi:hypothetical protein
MRASSRLASTWVVVGGLSLLFARPSEAQLVTHHDTVPDFAANPTITAGQSGAWSAPGTWGGSLPQTGDVVRIPPGVSVLYDVTSSVELAVIGIEGELVFDHTRPTRLVAGTIMVKPGGALQVGTASQPITTLAEIVIADRPVTDTGQYGTGLLVWGRLEIHGLPKTPWRRLAAAPRAGATTLQLVTPADDWQSGDRVVIPDSRHLPVDHPSRYTKFYKSQTEDRTLASVAPGGFLTLSTPLTYTHPDARDIINESLIGSPVLRHDGEPLVPHVANLTRNVVIRSQNPAGTRGHVWITDRADVSIRYAAFRDLGRTTTATLSDTTNKVGRYPLHLHHVWGQPRPWPAGLSAAEIRTLLETTGWQFVVEGNVVAGTGTAHKWGITLHDSHFGLVRGNVIYNIAGSGIQTEEGHESYNLIADNLAVRITGTGDPTVKNATTSDIGKDGSGLWLRGAHNWVEGNVAADTRFAAFYLSSYYIKEQRIPLFPGADLHMSSESRTIRLRPILSFKDNEGYGPVQFGLWGAWVSGCCNAGSWPDNRVERMTVWHSWDAGVKWYHNGRTTFDGVLIRGDSLVTRGKAFDGKSELMAAGFSLDRSGYEDVDQVYRNVDVEGMIQGFHMSRNTIETGTEPPLRIESARLKNFINIRVARAFTGRLNNFFLKDPTLQTFARPAHKLSSVPLNIFMHYNAESDNAAVSATSVRWDRGGSVAGVYFKEAGAPCTTQVAGVFGYVCP